MSQPSIAGDLGALSAAPAPVGVHLQVVPNGITDGGRLRATVLLTPDPRPGAETGRVPNGLTLHDWPTRVFDGLRRADFRLPLRVAPVRHMGSNARPHPGDAPDQVVSVVAVARRASQLPPAMAARLGDAWRACLVSNAETDWDTLKTLLQTTLEGSVGAAGAIADIPVGDEKLAPPGQDAFGSNGQLKPFDAGQSGNEKVESILAVRHADLALGLETERAEQFRKALNREGPDPVQAARSEPGQSEPPRPVAEEEESAAFRQQRIAEYQTLWQELRATREEAARLFNAMREQAGTQVCALPSDDRPQCLSPADASDPEVCARALSDARAVLTYATHPTYQDPDEGEEPGDSATDDAGDQAEVDPDEAIGQKFFALQSSPVLSRAFALAIDVEIDPSDLPATDFGFVACDGGLPGPAPRETHWTLTKLRQPGAPAPHFWPCTEGEMAASVLNCPVPETVSQIDGLVVVSRGAVDNGRRSPRFDVSCLDIRTTAQTVLDSEANQPDRTGAMRSAGFTLMDREALPHAVGRLVAHVTKGSVNAVSAAVRGDPARRDVVIDADDLTAGVRPLVALPDGAFHARWSPLMARVVTYGTSASFAAASVIEPALAHLIGRPDSAERLALEQGLVTPAARKVPVTSTDPEPGVLMVVDEAVLHWNGSPMGVDTATLTDGSVTVDAVEDILSLGRTVDLPRAGAMRAPRYRYGWPYRFALATVYSGGHSVPVTGLDRVAAATPEAALSACLYPRVPAQPGPARPWVRALRHAPIAAPVVLLPEGHALANGGALGPETGQRMVVRSVHSGPGEAVGARLAARSGPDLAQRLILVPQLGLDEIERHGMLDSSAETRPAGGLRNLRLVSLTGGAMNGFPVVHNEFERGPNGRRYLRNRRLDLTPRPPAPDTSDDTLGDAVFKAGNAGGNSRYYIDPAAETLVIGLRRPGERDYLGVTSVELGNGWPDRATVLLSCQRVTAYRDEPRRLDDLFQRFSGGFERGVRFDPARGRDIVTPGGPFQAREYRLRLAPTEAYDIDLWLAPSAERLAREFALIQSLGVHLAQCSHPGGVCGPDQLARAVDERLGNAVDPGLARRIRAAASTSNAFTATGGVVAPSMAVLRELAAAVRAHMLCQPLTMISGVTSLKAIHAANRTRRPGRLVQGSLPDGQAAAGDAAPLRPLTAVRRATNGEGPGPDEGTAKTAEPSVRGFALSGQIDIDLASTGAFEIRARMVLPATDTFDQPARRRSVDSRRAGLWPAIIDQDGSAVYRPGDDLFGFGVRRDGTVLLPEAEVTLLRVDDLPLPSDARGDLARGIVDLEPYFAESSDAGIAGRVTHRHDFPDGAARIMSVRVVTLPRNAALMQTVDRVASAGDPWTRNPLFAAESGELIDGEQLTTAELETLSPGAVTVVLPASTKPAKCEPGTSVPAFAWEDGAVQSGLAGSSVTITRRVVLRIALRRPWFQTGVDERLGVVLWPPFLTRADTEAMGADRVPLRSQPGGRPRRVNLPVDFRDRDLGPGGVFVTRRGGDPVRAGADERQTLLSLADFPDLDRPEGHPARAELVPVAVMPLESPADQAVQTPPMRVLLVTYAPRFDPEREEWFVDVTLDPGPSPEPFVRLGLVRYQPHTEPALRCSSPVVQWAQLMPDRRIEVTADRAAQRLSVHMTGRAPYRRAEVSLDDPPTPFVHPGIRETAAPRLRLTLFAEHVDGMGKVRRSILPLGGHDDIVIAADPTIGAGGDLVWRHEIDAAALNRPHPAASLHLLLEEYEYFLPADNPEPDASGEETLSLRASGPRLLRRIDLDPLMEGLGQG